MRSEIVLQSGELSDEVFLFRVTPASPRPMWSKARPGERGKSWWWWGWHSDVTIIIHNCQGYYNGPGVLYLLGAIRTLINHRNFGTLRGKDFSPSNNLPLIQFIFSLSDAKTFLFLWWWFCSGHPYLFDSVPSSAC